MQSPNPIQQNEDQNLRDDISSKPSLARSKYITIIYSSTFQPIPKITKKFTIGGKEYSYVGPDHPYIQDLFQLVEERESNPKFIWINKIITINNQLEQWFSAKCRFFDGGFEITHYHVLIWCFYLIIYVVYIIQTLDLQSSSEVLYFFYFQGHFICFFFTSILIADFEMTQNSKDHKFQLYQPSKHYNNGFLKVIKFNDLWGFCIALLNSNPQQGVFFIRAQNLMKPKNKRYFQIKILFQFNGYQFKMQRDYPTLEKFDKMFERQAYGFAHCRLCHQEIMLLDTDEVEFWRHQIDREHLDSLINFYLTQEYNLQGGRRKQIQKYEINKGQFKDKRINKLEKQMQKEAKRIMKTSQGGNQMKLIVDQLDRLMLQKQNNDDVIQRVKQGVSSGQIYEANADCDGCTSFLKQNLKKQKKLDPSQESFQQLVEEYFNIFIVELIKKQQLTEAICFLLGRIGVSSKQICEINFATIYWEIEQLQGSSKNLPHIVLALNVLKEVASKVEQNISEKNNGYLIKQPKKPKELRKKLESIRRIMRNEATSQDYKRFLERLKVKSLNALFKTEIKNQTHIIKKGQDSIEKEPDEIYIDISHEEDDEGSLGGEEQSGLFLGNESNPQKEQCQIQDQLQSENQSFPQQLGTSSDQAYLERVIDIIVEFEQQRIIQKQQRSLQVQNFQLNQRDQNQFDSRNQQWDESYEQSEF